MELDLEVEMELVYEWIADSEEDHISALEDTWFTRAEETLCEIEDAPARLTLRGWMMRLIGFALSSPAPG